MGSIWVVLVAETALFSILKLLGYLSLPWVIVLVPIWIPIVVLGLGAVMGFLLALGIRVSEWLGEMH